MSCWQCELANMRFVIIKVEVRACSIMWCSTSFTPQPDDLCTTCQSDLSIQRPPSHFTTPHAPMIALSNLCLQISTHVWLLRGRIRSKGAQQNEARTTRARGKHPQEHKFGVQTHDTSIRLLYTTPQHKYLPSPLSVTLPIAAEKTVGRPTGLQRNSSEWVLQTS